MNVGLCLGGVKLTSASASSKAAEGGVPGVKGASLKVKRAALAKLAYPDAATKSGYGGAPSTETTS